MHLFNYGTIIFILNEFFYTLKQRHATAVKKKNYQATYVHTCRNHS